MSSLLLARISASAADFEPRPPTLCRLLRHTCFTRRDAHATITAHAATGAFAARCDMFHYHWLRLQPMPTLRRLAQRQHERQVRFRQTTACRMMRAQDSRQHAATGASPALLRLYHALRCAQARLMAAPSRPSSMLYADSGTGNYFGQKYISPAPRSADHSCRSLSHAVEYTVSMVMIESR